MRDTTEDFITIENEGRTYYGGAQALWNRDSVGNTFGCGIIAATNIILNSQKTMTWEEYRLLADKLWNYMNPKFLIVARHGFFLHAHHGSHITDPTTALPENCVGIGIGVPTAGHLKRGLLRYAKEQGLVLDYEMISNHNYLFFKAPLAYGIEFITRNLGKERPVMMLTYHNLFSYADGNTNNYHWVTITGYEELTDTLIVSTWGEKRRISNFAMYWNQRTYLSYIYLVAFEIKDIRGEIDG